MPLILYPTIPDYQGVPTILRSAFGVPRIDINVVPQQDWLINQNPGSPQWGIFTLQGNPIYEPTDGGTLSVFSFGFTRSMNVSTFPVESNSSNQGAAFATYNKVYEPANPVVTLAFSGNEYEKTAFLAALDAACISTELFNVSTPDAVYQYPQNACTVDRYSYQRTATSGATMLLVEVSLRQVLQVNASLTNSPIQQPQSASAAQSLNNGNTQTTPDISYFIRQSETPLVPGVMPPPDITYFINQSSTPLLGVP